MSRLDAGESEALSLALELHADAVLMDGRGFLRLRRTALELHADAVLMDEAGWKVLRVWE